MASAKLTVTAPVDLVAAGEITSIAQLVSVLLVDASYGDITQAHFKQSVCTPIAIGSVAPPNPYVGLHWWDTSETRAVLRAYSGSDWYPVAYHRQEAAPSAPQLGDLWYDETLKMFRSYKTEDDITYWHPIEEGYQLRANEGGATIEAGDVVSWIAGVQSTRPCSQAGALEKLTNVIGVSLEEITVTSPPSVGVVAMVGHPLTVQVKVNTATHAIVKGDWLVTGKATAGTARSAGGLAINPFVSLAGKRSFGKPLGAFAKAQEDNSSGGAAVITATLADSLGDGFTVIFPKKQVAAIGDTIPDGDDLDATNLVDGTSRDIDLTDTPRSGTSVLESDKHEPILGAYVSLDAAVNGGAAENAAFTVGDHVMLVSGSTGGADIRGSMADVLAITSDGTGEMGQLLPVEGTTDSSAVPNAYNLYCHGYVC